MNVFETLRKLEGGLESKERKLYLSYLERFLENDADLVAAFLRVLFSGKIKSLLKPDDEEPYLEIDIHTYYDDNDNIKLALFVAYLQNYENHDPDLDEKMLGMLVETNMKMGLEEILNDISVNLLQHNF